MAIELIKALTKERQERIYELYCRAFPAAEQKPFSIMVRKQEEGSLDMLSIEEAGRFLGLAVMVRYEDRALVDFFAMDDSVRGQGYGSRALQALLKQYEGLRVILEIESTRPGASRPSDADRAGQETGQTDADRTGLTDTAADAWNTENSLRLRRKEFYHRNGMTDLPFQIDLWGTEMEMLSNGTDFSFEEYLELYDAVFGPGVFGHIRLLDQPVSVKRMALSEQ